MPSRISIPDESRIRVGDEFRHREEGRCLLFEDSIEHEVWNDSKFDRLILIGDFWHPDLNKMEREALAAGFRKREVREILYRDRLRSTNISSSLISYMLNQFATQDKEAVINKYWN